MVATAPSPRAVVFTLSDLPEADRAHIREVARRLDLPDDPGAWRTPLVLTAEAPGPLPPGLHGDADLAAAGPSLLLLAMRLLLADAYHWPERHFLAPAPEGGQAGYALYAAEAPWSVESLAAALGAEVRRGLQQRGPRPPLVPGDRVPVLGWQVPVLGHKDPGSGVRDLRPADQRPHWFGGVRVPLGFVPGHATDRHRLFLHVAAAHRDGPGGRVLLDALLIDGAQEQWRQGRLHLRLGDLSALESPPDGPWDDEALLEVAREVLPVCLLCVPGGHEVLLLDLFRLGLEIEGHERDFVPVRAVGSPRGTSPSAATAPVRWQSTESRYLIEEEWSGLLDPALWGLSTLASLVVLEETRVSPSGRFVSLRWAGRRDGLPVDTYLVIDTHAAPYPRALAWAMDLDGPAPSLAISPDEQLLALCMSANPAGPLPISPSCLERPEGLDSDLPFAAGDPQEILLLHLPPEGPPLPLRFAGRLRLPPALAGRTPPGLLFLPDSRSLLCYRHGPGALYLVTLEPGGAWVREAGERDIQALLEQDGGMALRHFLRAVAAGAPVEDIPALGFLPASADGLERLRPQAPVLLRAPLPAAVHTVCQLFLRQPAPARVL